MFSNENTRCLRLIRFVFFVDRSMFELKNESNEIILETLKKIFDFIFLKKKFKKILILNFNKSKHVKRNDINFLNFVNRTRLNNSNRSILIFFFIFLRQKKLKMMNLHR